MCELFGGAARVGRRGRAGARMLAIAAGCLVLACSSPSPAPPDVVDNPPPREPPHVPQVCIGLQPSPTLWNACGCDADCDAGQVCVDELNYGAPRGLCLGTCNTVTPCPDGFTCKELTPGDPYTRTCLPQCATSADCRQGYLCGGFLQTAELFCMGQCTSAADCPVLGVCDPYYGVCGLQTPRPGPADVGDPCTRNADCMSDFCIIDPKFPGGYCTAFCSIAAPVPGGCPTGSSCELIWGVTGELGFCLHDCFTHADCRPGYSCWDSALHDNAPTCSTF